MLDPNGRPPNSERKEIDTPFDIGLSPYLQKSREKRMKSRFPLVEDTLHFCRS
ncbi:hypothetical protein NEUTE1DRAFT_116969 [Neurospora tetrasperma FGSC 2508]|uniref:Uncharacterized protein n=1 Tax=Neurospora tetrasperma (strain FGSC 2508 / ATCC MYA-4615 / P0657) TaxID=510951 RepID=F8MMI6_NEUT8|nr:uncharacterized protein NEUTE1DRAFT_116969 [Neurospora tetrasperma FGSC 2508]EGO57860.1 hypothetical protein NEUTE1DRAFT_116969 [Neurospora tetrasperma FGSC 2508]EGZ71857.1 hypothetical protein NEUTE2DRAFT_144638 [Neurospora tetrasperma FGSC 2509]